METKNVIISNYARSISDNSAVIIGNASMLSEDAEQNGAVIATLNVNLESMRALVSLLQNALDTYFK